MTRSRRSRSRSRRGSNIRISKRRRLPRIPPLPGQRPKWKDKIRRLIRFFKFKRKNIPTTTGTNIPTAVRIHPRMMTSLIVTATATAGTGKKRKIHKTKNKRKIKNKINKRNTKRKTKKTKKTKKHK